MSLPPKHYYLNLKAYLYEKPNNDTIYKAIDNF